MDDSTRLGIGAAKLLLFGVVVVGTLAAAASVMRRAGDVVKPIAKLYDVNQVNSTSTPGGGLAPLSAAPSAGTTGAGAAAGGAGPAGTSPMGDPNALPQLLAQLSKNGNGDVKKTISELQRQLGQDSPRAEAPAGDAVSATELAEVKRQLAECQAQLRAATEAAEQERQQKEKAAVVQAEGAKAAVAAVEPDPAEAFRQQEADYDEAVRARREAEVAMEELRANPKATQEQIVAAAYELMTKRGAVTRLDAVRVKAHRMAVATVAD